MSAYARARLLTGFRPFAVTLCCPDGLFLIITSDFGLGRDFHGGSGEGKDGLSRSVSNLSAEDMQLSQGAAAKRKGRFQIVDDPDAKVC